MNKISHASSFRARHPPRTLLTVRRKFIILMVRSQLNDVSNPAIAPQGSPAWVRQLHELVFQHDNEVSHGDIKRWIKNHTWIAVSTRPQFLIHKYTFGQNFAKFLMFVGMRPCYINVAK